MTDLHKDILAGAIKDQPLIARYLVHLRQRRLSGNLTVVIGAGATTLAGPPMWDELLNRIRAKVGRGGGPKLQKYKKMGIHQATIGTILRNRYDAVTASDQLEVKRDDDWFRIIQSAIYKDVPDDREKWFEMHPYLWEMARFCHSVKLLINFNFDDVISEAMRYYAQHNSHLNLPAPSVIWKPTLLERNDSCLVYHINGVITKKVGKKRSETLVFTEDSFYDAELRSPKVRIDHVLARFVSTTMFIIGHSLSDNSLKGYLRQSKMINKANHHYIIHWIEKSDTFSEEERAEIFSANLELYNLITIFLTTEEINSFLAVLNSDDSYFRGFVSSTGNERRLVYYIVGPVAAGKTSVLEYLRCFDTHEEWLGDNPKEMYLASTKINEDQKDNIDNWVFDQIRLKNERLQNFGLGFVFIDRGPLDLFAFEKDRTVWKEKAKTVLHRLRGQRLVEGQVAFLIASGDVLEARNWKRGRTPQIAGTAEYLAEQAATLGEIYPEAKVFRTDELLPADIAAMIARAALFDNHAPVDLHEKLNLVADGAE